MKKLSLSILLLLTACAGTTQIHGSLVKPADVDKLRLGVHNQQQVMRILGTPSTVSTLNDTTWFYITDTKIKKPLHKPQLKERQVIGLVFNKEGVLDNVFEKTELESRNFEPSSKITKTNGKDPSFIDQMYWSLTSGVKSIN